MADNATNALHTVADDHPAFQSGCFCQTRTMIGWLKSKLIWLWALLLSMPVLAQPDFLEAFHKHSSIMLLINPQTGDIVDANAAARAFYGYSKEDFLQLSIQDINQLSAEQVAAERRLAASEGRSYFIFRHRLADDSVKTVEVASVPLNFSGQTLLYSVVRDISAQRETQESLWHYQSRLEEMVELQTQKMQKSSRLIITLLSVSAVGLLLLVLLLGLLLKRRRDYARQLRQNQKKFQRLVDGLEMHFLYSHDLDGVFTYVSPSVTSILGYTVAEFEADYKTYLTDSAVNEKAIVCTEHSIDGIAQLPYQLEIYHKNGERRMLEVLERPVVNDQGEVIAVEGIAQDISARLLLEEKLNSALAEAKNASISKSHFLATMSHEIRTPMNGVVGMTSLLLDTELDDEQRRYTETLRASADALLSIINDILDYSKLDAAKMDLESLTFDLHAVLDEMIDLFQPQAQSKGIRYTYRLESELAPGYLGDRGKLRQILTNLIDNAFKFTDSGRITLHVASSGVVGNVCRIKFSVEDSGIGISADYIPYLFESFTQENTAVARQYGGTGLGLAICKQLVNLMGGTIGINSVEGQGSSFWFQIPFVVADSSNEAPVEELSTEEKQLGPFHILVVEDNAVNQLVAGKLLENMGHVAHIAHDGLEALRLLENNRYDLIFMDMMMPGLDGLQTTVEIRKLGGSVGSVPIIALTANASVKDREVCLSAGMDDYIAKPITGSGLGEVIRSVMQGKMPD